MEEVEPKMHTSMTKVYAGEKGENIQEYNSNRTTHNRQRTTKKGYGNLRRRGAKQGHGTQRRNLTQLMKSCGKETKKLKPHGRDLGQRKPGRLHGRMVLQVKCGHLTTSELDVN